MSSSSPADDWPIFAGMSVFFIFWAFLHRWSGVDLVPFAFELLVALGAVGCVVTAILFTEVRDAE
jgi:ABC-type polysaccharide/polyol phosphate export permease